MMVASLRDQKDEMCPRAGLQARTLSHGSDCAERVVVWNLDWFEMHLPAFPIAWNQHDPKLYGTNA